MSEPSPSDSDPRSGDSPSDAGSGGTGFDLDEGLGRAAAAVGGMPRPGQQEMAAAVATALATGEHLLVQAGTGTGKSLAYLVPAFAHALAHRPVVVATATLALQRQLIDRDIPAIAEALEPLVVRPVRAAVLKGRHHYLCRLRLSGAEGSGDGVGASAGGGQEIDVPLWTESDPGGGRLTRQAEQVRRWALTTDSGDRDDLSDPVDSRVWRAVSVTATECLGRARCAFGEECFAERARDAAREADVIVTNHAMLALEVVEGIPVLPEYDGIIIDEGHEWIDRATQAATISLTGADIDAVSGALRRLAPDAGQALADAGRSWDSAVDVGPRGPAGARGADPLRLASTLADRPVGVTEAVVALRAAARTALGELPAPEPDASAAEIAGRSRIRARLDEIIAVCDRYLQADGSWVLWLAGTPVTLRIAPLAIDDLMGPRLSTTGLVVTSATLGAHRPGEDSGQPFTRLARALGIDDSPWRGLDVGSPFDYPRQGILYVPAHLPEPGRDGLDESVLDEMAELIEAAGGRTLALFSSWRGVERAAEYLSVRLADDMPVLVQHRGDPVGPLVEAFRSEDASVLVGTVSLWQGVDVPGDSCRLVVIDRIPFAPPDDPVLAARMDRVAQGGGSGFTEIALPRAATLLAQGVGRLIRGPEDRGVVAICDTRMVTKSYGRRLRDALPPLWFTTDPHAARGALRRLGAGAPSP